MPVTPSGPKNFSRFCEASQWSVSFTSWWAITVGMGLRSGWWRGRVSQYSPMRSTAIATLVLATLAAAPDAHAYKIVGERWPQSTINVASDAPRYTKSVRRAVKLWNRAKLPVRFRVTPSAQARVLFRYSGGRGSGRTGCEGVAGGTEPAIRASTSPRSGCTSSAAAGAGDCATSRRCTSWGMRSVSATRTAAAL